MQKVVKQARERFAVKLFFAANIRNEDEFYLAVFGCSWVVMGSAIGKF